MAPSSSIVLLLFSLTSPYFCHAHYSEKLPSSPLDFLKNLNGTYKGDQAKGLSELKKYLTNLGYIDYNSTTIPIHRNDDFFDDTLESAIKKYQEFYNLKTTGILDPETVTLMLQPRCGVADFHPHANQTQMGSLYTFLGTVWPPGKRFLTFSYPKSFRTDAQLPLALAMGRWMTVTHFNFGYRDDFGSADVKISFERGDHGDGYPFDGPYGVLAHSFPPTDGRLHFDAEENWQPNAEKGAFDLQTVALHEVGHILGLGHSPDPKAIMFPYFAPGQSKDLNQDDIQGIQTLYPN